MGQAADFFVGMAINTRTPPTGAVIHSDQGV